MLLNKYEKFACIAKDDYAEELLFKIEKNVGNFKTLQDRSFPHLHSIIQIFTKEDKDEEDEDEEKPSLVEKLKEADEHYKSLLPYGEKFNKLADNQDYVYKKFCEHLNAKSSQSLTLLKQTFTLCRDIGVLVAKMTDDCRGKATLIIQEVPLVIFTVQREDGRWSGEVGSILEDEDNDNALSMLMDVWTYRKEQVEAK